MSFWKSSTGKQIDGSERNAHLPDFNSIPDGTTAVAKIVSFEMKSFNESAYYQVVYKIVDGEFKNREVKQSIKCFEEDADKADRAKNMMLRLYNLCEIKATHEKAPVNEELRDFEGKLIGIKIKQYGPPLSEREGNWVNGIYDLNDPTNPFEAKIGKLIEYSKEATPRNNRININTGEFNSVYDDCYTSNKKSKTFSIEDDLISF